MEPLPISQRYLRVATACPEVAITDVTTNIDRIGKLYVQACEKGAGIVTFPELSVTGYSIGDLVRQTKLLEDAQAGVVALAATTQDKRTAMVVGLPLQVGNGLYNCAAVLAAGEIKGVVPKTHLPNYGEFQEKRWYQAWPHENTQIQIGQKMVPFGNDLLFDIAGVKVGIEICEDLWATDPPSRRLAEHGALVIANLSASPEQVGKANKRRQLVGMQSARLLLAYLYASADPSESTMDTVMSGHQMIYENGRLLKERAPLSLDSQRLLTADVDMDQLRHERRKDTNYPNRMGMPVVSCTVERPTIVPVVTLDADPFLPANESPAERAERVNTVMDIAAMGLMQRMKHIGIEKVVLGLSGGLDSTCALLIACRASTMLGKSPGDLISTLTMPGMASSERTQDNAQLLANSLNIPNVVIPIGDIARLELRLLAHDGLQQDTTYENVQARARTELLFNYANKNDCIVQGTGDLDEAALGFCTFNGDHMSSYNPNATLSKSMIAQVIRHTANQLEFADQKTLLLDILDTPVSPELKNNQAGQITQRTEEIIGPYPLHSFFETYLIRWGDTPSKVKFMARQAFEGTYSADEIDCWFSVFAKRFITNQFKRSVMADGPKVGAVAYSPRGDWRMPSDISTTAIWEGQL